MATSPTALLAHYPDHPQPAILHLFGGPYITLSGQRKEVPEGSKRLLVFVALHRVRVERRCAAGTLWPIGGELRAAGNLRSALWRLRRAGIDLIVADKWSLTLADEVVVDLRVIEEWAARLIGGTATIDDLGSMRWQAEALDLLPGWYDDWALMERERIRQRMLHALEALSRTLAHQSRWAEAVEAALAAVTAEPLRESAQRTLIAAHLAEGNWIEGRRAFDAYRDLLRRELGTEPSADLAALIDGPRASAGRFAGRGRPRPAAPVSPAPVPAIRTVR
jgi:DNA-binding SARP family transcriptional activator